MQLALNGQQYVPQTVLYTYYAPLSTVQSVTVTPQFSPGPAGDTALQLEGSNFLETGTVVCRLVTAGRLELSRSVATVLSPTQLSCRAPSIPLDEWFSLYAVGSTKYIGLEVSLNGQDFSPAAPKSWISYYNQTEVQLVHPLCGSAAGGTLLFLGGLGMEFAVNMNLPSCRFNRNFRNPTSEPGIVVPATKLPGRPQDRTYAYTCTTPPLPNVGTINIEFALNGQQFVQYDGNEDPERSFQAYLNLAVQSIEPLSGLHTGGEPITLNGVDFRVQARKRKLQCRFERDPLDVAEGAGEWLVVSGEYLDASHISCTTPPMREPLDKLGPGREAQVQFTLNGNDWEYAGVFTVLPIPTCFTCVQKSAAPRAVRKGTLTILVTWALVNLAWITC